ncbi:MAG: alkaline phosphatase family protein [Polyangia bacterium]
MRSLPFILLLAACGSAKTTSNADSGTQAGTDLAIAGDGSTQPGSDAGSTGDGAVTPPMTFPAGTLCNETGSKLTAPSVLKHLIVILEENENFGSVNGNPAAPYISMLATKCGQATNYLDNCFSANLVSLPHYLALTSGSNCDVGLDSGGTGCVRDDNDPGSHVLTTKSIFDQVSSWKSYQEGMPSACDMTSGGRYACKHNPPVYYSGLASCSANDIAIPSIVCSAGTKMKACTTPKNTFTDDLANDTLPAFAYVTPDLDNDMHDGTVTQGDNWLYTYLPLVLASPAYLRGEVAVLVLWDEQSSFQSGGATPNLFISPYITAGTDTAVQLNHFSVLRAMESALGISTYLGCASGSISGGATCPPGSTSDVRAAIGF